MSEDRDAATRGSDSRRAVSYLVAPEADDYVAIMAVLEASLTDMTPAEVRVSVARLGTSLELSVVEDRLDQLRGWGAASARTDTSRILRHADLLARNWRWTATPAGKQVQRFATTVLADIPAMREIPLTSLRRIVESLESLVDLDLRAADTSARAAELVGRVFTAHDHLDSALVGAEDTLATLADRFDLDDADAHELKTLLVEYATRVAGELETAAARAHAAVSALRDRFQVLAAVTVAESEGATLIERGALVASRGGHVSDWEQLIAWCAPRTGRAARFTGRLVRALPGMHANLRRLHATTGATTGKARALTMAQACLDPTHGRALFLAVLGDHPWRKLATTTDDDDLARNPSWAAGPKVDVPPLLRTAGRTGVRGRPPDARDDIAARAEVAARRELRAAQHSAAMAEVLAADPGTPLSGQAARVALSSLMAAVRTTPTRDRRSAAVDGLACTLYRCPDDTGVLLAPAWLIRTPGRVPVFHPAGTRARPPARTEQDFGAVTLNRETVA